VKLHERPSWHSLSGSDGGHGGEGKGNDVELHFDGWEFDCLVKVFEKVIEGIGRVGENLIERAKIMYWSKECDDQMDGERKAGKA